MVKVKVEVLNAVVDGYGKGSMIEIDERSASYLQTIGYVKIAPIASGEKGESAPKKPAAKKRTKTTK